jgi:hypothetical protein
MKLYEVPRNTWVKVTDEDWVWEDEFYFLRPDGMYSMCLGTDGELIHLSLNMQVEVMEQQAEMPRSLQ